MTNKTTNKFARGAAAGIQRSAVRVPKGEASRRVVAIVDDGELIESDPAIAVAQLHDDVSIDDVGVPPPVDDDEIVSIRVHFFETERHLLLPLTGC